MDIGPSELLIILAVVLVIFGGAKIPKLARNLGQAQSEFKKGLAEGTEQAPSAPAPAAAEQGEAAAAKQ